MVYQIWIENGEKSYHLQVTGNVVEIDSKTDKTIERPLNDSDINEIKKMLQGKVPEIKNSEIQKSILNLG